MKIVLLGAPGSGKGTRAKYISEYYNIPHISTGDLFRENMANNTEIGIKVKEVMTTGRLCPDDLTVSMVKDRLSQPDCVNGYILDGFPRNLFQAKRLDEISAPDKVVNIDIAFEKLEKRIVGRRVCSSCHTPFHVDVIGDSRACPNCGGELIHRKDDTPEVLKQRLEVYQKETKPLFDYYKNQNKVVSVDGEAPLDKMNEWTKKVLQ